MRHKYGLRNILDDRKHTLQLKLNIRNKTNSKIRLNHKLPPDFFGSNQPTYGRKTPAFGHHPNPDQTIHLNPIQWNPRVQTLPLKEGTRHYLSRQQARNNYNNISNQQLSNRVYSEFQCFEDDELISQHFKFNNNIKSKMAQNDKLCIRMRKNFDIFFKESTTINYKKELPKKLPPI